MQMQTVVQAPSAFTHINWGDGDPHHGPPRRRTTTLNCTSAGGGGGGFAPVTGLTFECPPTLGLFEEIEAERPPCSDTTSVQPAFGNGNGRNSKPFQPFLD